MTSRPQVRAARRPNGTHEPEPPPNDMDAEAAVLSTVMLDAERLPEVREILQPRDFFSLPNRRIYEAILSLADDGRPVDEVTVASTLKAASLLREVGGTPYLGQIINATPAVANVEAHAEIVRDRSLQRTLSAVMQTAAAQLRTGADPTVLAGELRAMLERVTRPAAPPVDPFEGRWLRLADTPDLLATEPPKQRWLLTRYQDARDHGVLPRGRCGLLTGTGGVSKTYAAMQLGVAVASGGFWLETFKAAEAGHVLLAVAEEDQGEAHRRLNHICNALELSREERRAVSDRLDVLPLHGLSVPLIASPAPGQYEATDVAEQLHKRLVDRGVDWALIVIDPLSRWAGGGAEADNEAATRFVQIVETFTDVPGNPSVMLTHHSSKTSAASGTSDARGVTGIRDGFRWMATLDAIRTEDGQRAIRLRNGKSNYSLEFDDLLLVRNTDQGLEGTLRLASAAEATVFGHATTGKVAQEDLADRLLRTLRSKGSCRIKREIVEATPGEDRKLYSVLNDLISSERVIRNDAGRFVAADDDAAEGAAAQ